VHALGRSRTSVPGRGHGSPIMVGSL
jgi:hypothetical protein